MYLNCVNAVSMGNVEESLYLSLQLYYSIKCSISLKAKCFKETMALCRYFTVPCTFTNIILYFEHTQQRFKVAIQSLVVGEHIQEIIKVFQPDGDLVQSRITLPLLLPHTQNPLKFIYKNIMKFSAQYANASYIPSLSVCYAFFSLFFLYAAFALSLIKQQESGPGCFSQWAVGWGGGGELC